MLRRPTFLPAALALAASVAPVRAGVVNPDISVVGQPFVRWTDDAGETSRSETWSFNPAPSVNAPPLGHSTQTSLGSRQGTAADCAASFWRSHA